MDRVYTPKQFINYPMREAQQTGKWSGSSLPNSGPTCPVSAWDNAVAATYKKLGTLPEYNNS